MRVLVTFGSKMGGTAGIAEQIGDVLRRQGLEARVMPADRVRPATLAEVDAVIVGGGLYANLWQRAARRFVARHVDRLRRVPVWFFSSGPLDTSADGGTLPPTGQVKILMERVGALGHVTFGGRLPPDARGMAGAMARTHAGDWRDPRQIATWAEGLARDLPLARPGAAIDHPAGSWTRLLAHGVVGWGAHAAALAGLLAVMGRAPATALHVILVLAIFTALAWSYFRRPGAREPWPAALAIAATTGLCDLVAVSPLLEDALARRRSLGLTWLPLVAIVLCVWATGAVMATLPWPKLPRPVAPAAR